MNIVFTVAGLQPRFGGPSRSVPLLASALADTKTPTRLVALHEHEAPVAGNSPRCELVRVPCRHRYWPMGWQREFTRAISDFLVNRAGPLLHDHGVWLPSNHLAATVARRLPCRRVVSPRGMLSSWALQQGGLQKRLAWLAYQERDLHSAHLLHATSSDEANDFRSLGLRNPVVVIPNGIDVPPAVPSRLSPIDSRRTVLFLSRIHPKKGLLDLVSAWAQLRSQAASSQPSTLDPQLLNNWRLVIVGPDEGGHQRAVESAAERAGVRQDISFIGAVDDQNKWDIYSAADVFVLPSYSENFGIVVGEALAAGLPVITTRATPWRELEEHRCGWWIETGAQPLAAALLHAFSLSDAERREMGTRGRELVVRKYSWTAAAHQMIAAYEWLLHGACKPGFVHT